MNKQDKVIELLSPGEIGGVDEHPAEIIEENDDVKKKKKSKKDQEEIVRPWFIIDNNRMNYKGVGDLIINTVEYSKGSRILTMKDTKEVYVYKAGLYVQDKDYIDILTQELLGTYSNVHNKKQILDYIKTETLIDRKLFNKAGYEINLKNGIYDISTDGFREVTREDLFTYQFPINYNISSVCPCINSFFERILPAKDIRTVQEEISYCFVPGYPIQSMFWWIGEGANGKGTIFRLMQKLLSKQNMSFSSVHELAINDDYCRAELYGKRVNVCGDVSRKDLGRTDFIKKATGGDELQARKIRDAPFTFTNEAKFFFAMNDAPDVDDGSDGFWRRPINTEFNAILGEDERSKFKEEVMHTEEEISGFFNCLMKHIKVIIKNNQFTDTPTADDSRDSLTETESLDLFFNLNVSQVPGQMYEKRQMYEDYVEFANTMKMVPLIYNQFLKNLRTTKEMDPKQRVDPEDGKKKRFYIGYVNNKSLSIPKLKI